MNHVDLFTGIAGFSLAAQWVWGEDHNIILFCENDKFCQKRLRQLWPDVPIIEDITKLDGKTITETVDICTFGWPCQPYSFAGKRKGKEDDRYIWPEAYRVIQETNPTWLIGENVTGIIGMELDDVLSDLESIGYETQTFNIPACGVDAKHPRYRVWIVAHSDSVRCNKSFSKWHTVQRKNETLNETGNRADAITNTKEKRSQRLGSEGKQITEVYGRKKLSMCDSSDRAIWSVEPDVARVVHGVSPKLDRERIAALGNAIVPQVVVVIMRGIKEIELDR